ncbi:hypothetical protein WA158_004726 [Blastocystis sp. Blastoise]
MMTQLKNILINKVTHICYRVFLVLFGFEPFLVKENKKHIHFHSFNFFRLFWCYNHFEMVAISEISKKFVNSYYTALAFKQEMIPNFYSNESSQRISFDSVEGEVVVGKANISTKLSEAGFYGVVVNLDHGSLNYLETLNDSILILVTGKMYAKDSSIYSFSEVFILTADPRDKSKKHYFIKSDMLSVQKIGSVQEQHQEIEEEEEQNHIMVEEQKLEEQKEETVPVVESIPTVEPAEPVAEPAAEIEQPVVEEPVQTVSAPAESVAVPEEPVAPVTEEKKEENKSTQTATRAAWADMQDSPVEEAATVSIPTIVPVPRHNKKQYAIYIKNVPQGITEEDIASILRKEGEVLHVHFMPSKPVGFIDLESEEFYRELLETYKEGIKVKDNLLLIEPKREKPRHFPYNNRSTRPLHNNTTNTNNTMNNANNNNTNNYNNNNNYNNTRSNNYRNNRRPNTRSNNNNNNNRTTTTAAPSEKKN